MMDMAPAPTPDSGGPSSSSQPSVQTAALGSSAGPPAPQKSLGSEADGHADHDGGDKGSASGGGDKGSASGGSPPTATKTNSTSADFF